MAEIIKKENNKNTKRNFRKAALALGISIIADALDYVGSPIFALPVIGDVADLIVLGLLFRITKSKANLIINAIEFIPFVGDLVPTYTISTLLWIVKESRKKRLKKETDYDRIVGI